MVRVIERKILGVQNLQNAQIASSLCEINLGTSKSDVKFSNAFNLDSKLRKWLFFTSIA